MTPETLLTPGTRVGPYQITGPLASGGMGVVYRAEDERLHRPVAIKFLSRDALDDPRAFERFQQEAQTASSLNHPNICTVHDIGEHGGQPFLVMELIEGQALASRLGTGALQVEQAVRVGVSIADALAAAHERHIVHRDVKPANILITGRGDAKLLDFGIARLSAAVDPTATHTETTAGTVAYMSPEQARNEPLDHRTDLFSFGLVLYEMVTGIHPFAGASPALILDGILNRTPRPASQISPRVPAELDRVILRALEKDRSLRYQSAAHFAEDLKRRSGPRPRRRSASKAGTGPRPFGGPSLRRRLPVLLHTRLGEATLSRLPGTSCSSRLPNRATWLRPRYRTTASTSPTPRQPRMELR